MSKLTLAEAMAVAVLQGDKVAAYALADRLAEEAAGLPAAAADARPWQPERQPQRRPPHGRDVYHWPEFRALAERLGLAWDLATHGVRITLSADETVLIEQSYRGGDAAQTAQGEDV